MKGVEAAKPVADSIPLGCRYTCAGRGADLAHDRKLSSPGHPALFPDADNLMSLMGCYMLRVPRRERAWTAACCVRWESGHQL